MLDWSCINMHASPGWCVQKDLFYKRLFIIIFFYNLRNVFSPRKFGMLGLFKGLEAKLLQTVLTAALMFLLYEKIASCTFRVMGLSRHHKHAR